MMFDKYILTLIIIAALLILPQCKQRTSSRRTGNTITIWVHGTRLTPPLISPRFFYHKPGFTPAYHIDHCYQWHTIAQTLIDNDPQRFSWDGFYFYGWSGKLCPHERFHAAHELHHHILTAIQAHKKLYKQTPRVRIIAHSHGGNVALNMARLNQASPLVIDELILLACPVQQQTASLIQHSMFNRVYSLYSRFDSFQVMDMQGFHKDENGKRFKQPLLSGRTFELQPHVAQVKLSWKKRGIMHIEFITAKFLHHVPWILDSVDRWYDTFPPDAPKEPWSLRIDR